MTVAVVTDSTADIPSEVASELGITVIPLHVQFGKESFRDGIDMTPADFYQRLENGPEYPKTSTPSVGDFVKVYSEVAKQSGEVIAIHLGSKISATYGVAVAGAREVEEDCRIEVVDSETTLMAQGLLVIEVAKAAREGMGLDELTSMVKELIPKAHVAVTFDTIKYLHKGGHASKVQVFLGAALKVNPIVEIKGEILPYGKAIGRRRSMDALIKYANSFPRPRSLAVQYCTDVDEGRSLVERLEKTFPGVPVYTSTLGPVAGTHSGPHGLAVSLLEE